MPSILSSLLLPFHLSAVVRASINRALITLPPLPRYTYTNDQNGSCEVGLVVGDNLKKRCLKSMKCSLYLCAKALVTFRYGGEDDGRYVVGRVLQAS